MTRRLFEIRREQELAALRQAENALTAAAEKATIAVKGEFQRQIAECRRKLTDDADDWPALRRIAQTSVRPVLDEVFAYTQAVLYRKAGLDNGIGAIAQWMVDDLAARAGIRHALLAFGRAELIVHTFSMIRMRFQDTTVWRLPVLAHELGHHVAHHLRDVDFAAFSKFPALKLLQDEARTSADHSRLHELFADVFATYALGAAYPLCAIVLQAEPDQGPDDHTETHPSWPLRVRTMISALHAMGEDFKPRADKLVTPFWSSLTSGRPEPTDLAGDLVALLARHTPGLVRLDADGPADRLYEAISAHDPGEPPPGTTIPLVLEAAWRWRVRNLDASPALFRVVSDNAKHWCWAVMR